MNGMLTLMMKRRDVLKGNVTFFRVDNFDWRLQWILLLFEPLVLFVELFNNLNILVFFLLILFDEVGVISNWSRHYSRCRLDCIDLSREGTRIHICIRKLRRRIGLHQSKIEIQTKTNKNMNVFFQNRTILRSDLQILLLKLKEVMKEDRSQREKSLKKLHQSILTYEPSSDCKKMMVKAKQQLRDNIEFKYLKSEVNKRYKFPRKFKEEEQFDQQIEICNLHEYNYNDPKPMLAKPNKENEAIDSKPDNKMKPKIKLVKTRIESKRLKTDYVTSNSEKSEALFDKNLFNCSLQKFNTKTNYNYQSEKIADHNLNVEIPPYIIAKQRIKTDYHQKNNDFPKRYDDNRSIQKGYQHKHFINSLRNESTRKSKSKLNLLTKSYMNIKSAKNPIEKSLNNEFDQSFSIIGKENIVCDKKINGGQKNMARMKTEAQLGYLKSVKGQSKSIEKINFLLGKKENRLY